jgi:hypothetical protein
MNPPYLHEVRRPAMRASRRSWKEQHQCKGVLVLFVFDLDEEQHQCKGVFVLVVFDLDDVAADSVLLMAGRSIDRDELCPSTVALLANWKHFEDITSYARYCAIQVTSAENGMLGPAGRSEWSGKGPKRSLGREGAESPVLDSE